MSDEEIRFAVKVDTFDGYSCVRVDIVSDFRGPRQMLNVYALEREAEALRARLTGPTAEEERAAIVELLRNATTATPWEADNLGDVIAKIEARGACK